MKKLLSIIACAAVLAFAPMMATAQDVPRPELHGATNDYISAQQFDEDVDKFAAWTMKVWENQNISFDANDPGLKMYFAETLFAIYSRKPVRILGTPKFKR